MSDSYSFSILSDFTNSSQVNIDQLSQIIEKNATIGKVGVTKQHGDDTIIISFSDVLTSAEDTELTSIISSYLYLEIFSSVSPNYEATDSLDGSGDYESVAAAFADGKASVKVSHGTYIESADIVIPTYGRLDGESSGAVIIYFTGNFSVKLDGSNGVKQENGSISIANLSNVVTGVGTTFTALNPLDFILIGTNFYEIATINSDTSLTLTLTYVGSSISNSKFIAQSMLSAPSISNLTVMNSGSSGIYVRGVRHGNLKSIAIVGCAIGLDIVDSGDASLFEILPLYNGGDGLRIDNSISISMDTVNCFNNGGNGMNIKNNSHYVIIGSSATENNLNHGINIENKCGFVDLNNVIVKYNNANGVQIDGTCTQTNLSGCEINDNNGNGVDFEEDSKNNKVVDNFICQNEGNGINGSCNCIISTNIISENKGFGIHSPAHENCSILNNIINLNTENGINITSGKYNSILNNTIFENAKHGIYLQDTTYSTVNTNNINNNGEDGIILFGACVRNSVCNNTTVKNGINGINVTNTSSNNIVSTNNSFENVTSNLTNSQTGGIETNNLI
jgi:parallel beta-helix repeat protein